MDSVNASMSNFTDGLDPIARAYANESFGLATIGVIWRLLVLGIILNALFCHISPGLMVRLQSNPWTTQFNWLFGVKAQNFQTLNLVLYHQSFMGKVSHYPTIAAEFFAWAHVVYFGLGAVSSLLMLLLVIVQAASSRFMPLAVATSIAALAAFTGSVSSEELSAESQLWLYRFMQLLILIGGPVRVFGHYFEEKTPPMPISRQESTLFRFKSAAEVKVDFKMVSTVGTQAVFAEASAGMPLRLFVPMVNYFIGVLFNTTDETRPPGLESVQALKKDSSNVLKKGWTMTRPSTAALIRVATRLETAPDMLPDMFLEPKWYCFFIIECMALTIISLGWLLAPNALITRFGWATYTSDDTFCCGLAPDGDAVTPVAFALAVAASLMLCGFVWVMLRMLSAKNLDMRAFCYVLEGMTLCGVFLFIFVLALQVNGLVVTDVKGTVHRSPDIVALFIISTLLLAFSAIHFFFLHIEVPRLRARHAIGSEMSTSVDPRRRALSSASSSSKKLRNQKSGSSVSGYNLLVSGRGPAQSIAMDRSETIDEEDESNSDQDEVFPDVLQRFSGRMFRRLSYASKTFSRASNLPETTDQSHEEDEEENEGDQQAQDEQAVQEGDTGNEQGDEQVTHERLQFTFDKQPVPIMKPADSAEVHEGTKKRNVHFEG